VRSGSASRLEVDHELTALFARVMPLFLRPRDLFLSIGAFWSVPGVGNLLRQLKNAGVTVGIFIHDVRSVTEPSPGAVRETGHTIKAVVEALTFADFIVTESENDKASIAWHMVSRQLPPLPVDVVPLAQERSGARPWRTVAEDLLHSAWGLARRIPPFDGI